jgi:multidrug resistance efflux pump
MMEEARQAWELMKAGPRSEEIAQAQAARDAAQAAVAVLDRQAEELVIRAPTAAVVEALDLRPGDLVSANAPILSLVDHQRLWVRAYVPANRLNFQLGHRVIVTLDSFPNDQFPAEVTFISQQGEFTPSNVQTPEERTKQVFRIKVMLVERAKELRPGMIADVWLEGMTKPEAPNSKPASSTNP